MADIAPNARPRPTPGLKEWLFDPFTYIAGDRSLAVGVAAILLAGAVGSFSAAHFDGVLDFHIGRPAPLWVFLYEGIVAWLSAATILLVLGKLVSRTAFRAVDLYGTQAMARWPTLLMAALAAAPRFQRSVTALANSLVRPGVAPGIPVGDAVVLGLVPLASVALAVWMIALMYRSFSLCCNLRGGKAVVTFIAGLLGAEVVSKLALLAVLVR